MARNYAEATPYSLNEKKGVKVMDIWQNTHPEERFEELKKQGFSNDEIFDILYSEECNKDEE